MSEDKDFDQINVPAKGGKGVVEVAHGDEISLAHGVGVNDMFRATPKSFYRMWYNMLSRCYYTNSNVQKSAYEGDYVADEWHYLSAFYNWLMSIRGYSPDGESSTTGKCIDKNLIVPCTNVYSKETCIFVSRKINKLTFIRDRDDNLPIGLREEKTGYYSVRFCNKYIGTKETPIEAHMLWLNARIDHLSMAVKAFQTEDPLGAMLLERHVKVMQLHYDNKVEFKRGNILMLDNDNIDEILGLFYKDK